MQMLRKSLIAAGVLVLAIVLGIAVAMLRLRALADINDIHVGPWRTSSLIGSSQASPYLRAVVAVNGILALSRQEAVYFTATTDDEGRALSGACRYRITGVDLPARWWSLTAYGEDRFLIRNPMHSYSVTMNSVARDVDGRFAVSVGVEPEPADWIAVAPGHFVLTLRAYGPEPAVLAPTPATRFPSIALVSCT